MHVHAHSYMQPAYTPKGIQVTKTHLLFSRVSLLLVHIASGRGVPQFHVNPMIHMPIRKRGNEFTSLQLIGVRYCSLCIAHCTDIPLAGWRLRGAHGEGCSVLVLACGVTSGSVKPDFGSGCIIPRHLWIAAIFHAAFVLLFRLTPSLFQKSLWNSWLLFNPANVTFFIKVIYFGQITSDSFVYYLQVYTCTLLQAHILILTAVVSKALWERAALVPHTEELVR